MKVYLKAFGCSASFSDSEIMAGLLEEKGFEIVDREEKSDLNILVTCNVKLPTEKRMINEIKKFSSLNKPLIVAGCMPSTQKELIEKINQKASLLGPNSISKIVEAVKETMEGKKIVFLENLKEPKVCLPRVQRSKVIHITQISTGCNLACSYCIVRINKGNLFSFPFDLIVKDVENAIKKGKKEVWITSQDNSSYNYNGKNLANLLEKICEIEGKFFVRVGMINPFYTRKILEELIQAYKNEKVFKFLHLPIQSFSESVLEKMRRGYKPKDALEIIEKFYEAFPNLTLSTDIIVGFPSETEQDFQQTLKFIEKVKPDIVNISKFGPRPGTEAAKMKQLPQATIKKRSKEAFELVRRISFEKNQKWLNWEGLCLIDEKGAKSKTFIARNFAYKPIVVKSEKNLLGQFKNVRIIEAKSNYLIGEIIS
ncbi:MAG: tRNA (N(6)-L-threonylcarbamoyladenosine(37)-C(2))-methylthiotransferase [Candidatus Aenigmatarchaeota archaeon]